MDQPLRSSDISVQVQDTQDTPTAPTAIKPQDLDHNDHLLQGSSVFSAGVNMGNAAIGAGILLFPHLYANLGLLLAIFCYILVTGIMILALHTLSMGAMRTGEVSYQGVMRRLISEKISLLIEISMTLYILGTCVSFVVVVVDMSAAVFFPNQAGECTFFQRFIITTVTCVLIFPLMLLKDISALELGSFAGVLVNIFAALVIAIESLIVILNNGIHDGFEPFYKPGVSISDIASAMSTYTFSNEMTLVFIPIFHTIENKSVRKGDSAGMIAYTLCFICYFTCGTLGYMAYGDQVQSDILAKNLPPRAVMSNIARVCLALKSFVHYPLVHFPARLCILDMWMGVKRKWRGGKGGLIQNQAIQNQSSQNQSQSQSLRSRGSTSQLQAEAVTSESRNVTVSTVTQDGQTSGNLQSLEYPRSSTSNTKTISQKMSFTERLSNSIKHQYAVHRVARNNIFRAKHSAMRNQLADKSTYRLSDPNLSDLVAGLSGNLRGSTTDQDQNQTANGSQKSLNTNSLAMYQRSTALRLETKSQTQEDMKRILSQYGNNPNNPNRSNLSSGGPGDGGNSQNLNSNTSQNLNSGPLSEFLMNSENLSELVPVLNPGTQLSSFDGLGSGSLMKSSNASDLIVNDNDLVVDLDNNTSNLEFLVVTTLFLLISWAATILFTNLGKLIDLVSALFGVPQVYLYPGLALYQMGNGKTWTTFGGGLLVIFGLYISIASVAKQLT